MTLSFNMHPENSTKKSGILINNVRTQLYLAIALLIFFISILLADRFTLNHVLVGVLREILTIPALLLSVLVVISAFLSFKLYSFKFNSIPFLTIVIMVCLFTILFFAD